MESPESGSSAAAEETWSRVRPRLVDLVGPDHVVDAPEEVELRARVTLPRAHRPVAYVYQGSADEVQAIVRLANEHGLRLWASSTGRNFGYGAATPAAPGTVFLVLERMDRIVEVNEELAYAVIEPGVTYRQLHAHLVKRGYTLWSDSTDGPPDGSVLGNALEKGVGETPYGDHFGNLCGLEVVLPTGERVETGGGPTGRTATFHTYKWGTGPYLEGLFAQSNLGIVTRAGIWLMPRPEAMLSFTFGIHREEDLPAVVDAVRRLALRGVLQTKVHMINDFVTLSLISQYPWEELAEGETRLSDAARARLRDRYQVPTWSFGAGLYGTRAAVRAQKAEVKAALGPYGRLAFLDDRRVRFVERRLLPALRWMEARPGLRLLARVLTRGVLRRSVGLLGLGPRIHAMLRGEPSDEFVKHAYFKSRRHPEKPEGVAQPARDGIGLLWLAPVIPMTGEHMTRILELLDPLHREHGFDLYVAVLVVNPRSLVILLQLLYDKQDPEEAARAKALYEACREACEGEGYQQYRTSVACASVLSCAPEFLRLAETLKRAVDPQGVLAPGRYGIAPVEPEEDAPGEDEPGGPRAARLPGR